MYQITNYYHANDQKISEYKLQSRFLWDDHISYTRNAVVSILAILPDVDAISQRLLKNQEDIGDFIGPYYSKLNVNTFVDLLKEHIIIAVDVINDVEGAEDKWRMNGTDIVNQMYKMNRKYWPPSVIGPLWSKHLDLTIAQVDARKDTLWTNDIKAYDDNHICMSKFADTFSTGVIYQNMDMFCYYMNGDQYG